MHCMGAARAACWPAASRLGAPQRASDATGRRLPAVSGRPASTRTAAQPAGSAAAHGTSAAPPPYAASLDLQDSETLDPGTEAVLMLGGGLLPGGALPPWVVRRLHVSLLLYHQLGGRAPIVLLGAGTPHKPAVVDARGYVVYESSAYADWLLQHGVPASHLLKEAASYDTVGNGYFSLTIHALPAGWRRLAVVTSAFHLPRTRAIFDTVYALGATHPSRTDRPPAASTNGGGAKPAGFQLSYHAASDAGLFDPEVAAARAVKEAGAAAAWRANAARLSSLADLHAWLYATHLCYSVGRQAEFGREDDLDPRLAATY